MTKYLISLLVAFSSICFSQEDTLFVQAHDYVDMDSHGNFDQWAFFPNVNDEYRKIIMHYDLRCGSPNNSTWPGCSGWDYTTKISLLKNNGFNENGDPVYIHDQTLANVITPYGTYMQGNGTEGFSPDWVQRYSYDVTDFAPLLKDSVLIRAFYGGWPQSGAGGCFNVTLNFEFIKGTPPRNVLNVQNLWSGSSAYSSMVDVLQDTLVFIPEEAKNSAMRVTISGHGQDGEFTSGVNYYLELDSEDLYSQEIWRDDCGEVALYPQGGTWVYDRANWCPGDKATTRKHELTSFLTMGQENLLDFDIYKSNWNPSAASYIYDVQLITYDEPNFNLDAVMEDIIAPSTKQEHFRFNPTCSNPIVKIKNQGSENLISAHIVYGFNGYDSNTYIWEGNLAFGETEIIYLPPINWYSWNENNLFYARINMPNAQLEDDYTVNDMLYTDYDFVQEYPSTFAIWFKTNEVPNESSYELSDNQGNLIFSKSGMSANTLYKDTVQLDPGCYKFQILDTGGNQYNNEDGLTWWANNDGSGYARLREVPGGFFKYYQDDFGTELTDYFRVGEYNISSTNELIEPIIELFPNPSKNEINLDIELLSIADISIFIYDVGGRIVFSKNIYDTNKHVMSICLDDFRDGIYNCIIQTGNDLYSKKIIVIK